MSNSKPEFLLSKKKVLEQYKKVSSLADFVSYSSKTNPEVTKILEENTDSYFSVHSVNELNNVKNKKRIIFLAQGWDFEEIEYLIKEGINFFVVDNKVDFEVLKNYISKNEVSKINLFLRLKLKENTLKTEKYFVFGFDSETLSKEIKILSQIEEIKSLGVHFHRKTQNMAEWNLAQDVGKVLDEETLHAVDYIILGGGLPSVYANTNIKVFEGIFKRIKEFNEFLNSKGIKSIIEPGRFIAAPSVKLVTNVKAVYEKNIIVDASLYNSDLDALIVPVKLLVEGELEKGQGEAYSIKGITPCSMDLFRYRVYLNEIKKGDKIVFLNAGAYNFATDFCDLNKIETKVVEEF